MRSRSSSSKFAGTQVRRLDLIHLVLEQFALPLQFALITLEAVQLAPGRAPLANQRGHLLAQIVGRGVAVQIVDMLLWAQNGKMGALAVNVDQEGGDTLQGRKRRCPAIGALNATARPRNLAREYQRPILDLDTELG